MVIRNCIRFPTAAALAVVAFANIASSAPDDSSKMAARAFMAEGRAHRTRKELQAALDSFRAADAIMHVPTTALEVARTQVALGSLVEAKETLAQLATSEPSENDPPQFAVARLAANALSDELSKRIPVVRVSLKRAPIDARPTVWADGVLVPAAAYATGVRFNPGSHTVAARAGSAEAKQVVDIVEGQTMDVSLDLGTDAAASEDPIATATKSKPRPDAPSSSSVSPVVYVLGSAAVLALGAGVTFTILERQKVTDLHDQCAPRCTEDQIAPARSLLTLANGSFVAAGVTAAAAVIWYAADSPGKSSQRASNTAAVPLAAQPTRGGVLVEWSGSF